MYYLYLVQCADKTLYAGITTDLARRVREHNESASGARYTRARRPVTLVYSRKFKDRSAATKAEAKLKKLSRAEKLKLIK
jgi:putative endonuclease